jgi:hypothetical protein
MMSCQQQDRAAAVPVTMATMRIDGLVVAERLAGDPNAPVVVLTPSRDAATSGDRLAHPPARAFTPKNALSGEALAGVVA